MSGEPPKVDWEKIAAWRSQSEKTYRTIVRMYVEWKWFSLVMFGALVGTGLSFVSIREWVLVAICCASAFMMTGIHLDCEKRIRTADADHRRLREISAMADGELLLLEEQLRRVREE